MDFSYSTREACRLYIGLFCGVAGKSAYAPVCPKQVTITQVYAFSTGFFLVPVKPHQPQQTESGTEKTMES
jgi:hypothetical protein